jgi:lipopolysaccharide export system permease protein
MKIVSRYMLTAFLRILGLTVMGLVMVYLVVDFLEKIDNFMAAGVPLIRAFYFFLMMIPGVIFNITPVAVLIAILISVGIMARRSEIVAFKAVGISLYRLSLPIFLASLLVSVLLFVLSDQIIPHTAGEVNHIWNVEVEKSREASPDFQKDVWFKGDRMVLHIDFYNIKEKIMEGVSLFRFGDNFILRARVEAREVRLVDGRWEAVDGMEKEYHETGDITLRNIEREWLDLPHIPEKFGLSERLSDEMNIRELKQWIQVMDKGGYDPLRYLVDLQLKFSFPFICTIMAVIGLPIAFWKEKGGGIALGIGIGISLSFVYLVILGLSRALGYAGLLPPVVAAWMPNILFIFLGFYLFTNVRQ